VIGRQAASSGVRVHRHLHRRLTTSHILISGLASIDVFENPPRVAGTLRLELRLAPPPRLARAGQIERRRELARDSLAPNELMGIFEAARQADERGAAGVEDTNAG
jgi:hypothetical protein